MKYLIYISSIAVSLAIIGCGSGNTNKTREAKGDVVLGGKFTVSTNSKVQSLYPAHIVDVTTNNIASHIYEGLVKFSTRDLSVQPNLAESWKVSEDGTQYTFKLKKGIKFQDDECFGGSGREMIASDVLYSYKLLCSQSEENVLFNTIFKDVLKGANAYYEASKNGKPEIELEGVKVIDDYTIELTLEKPNASFLYKLAHVGASVIPKEAVEKYGSDAGVGTGPFVLPKNQNMAEAGKLLLVRNTNYHESDTLGNQLPYLDTLVFALIDSKKAELKAFKKKEVDVVIGLPSESIREVVEEQIANFQSAPPKFILDRTPEMATDYYELNTQKEIFKNVKVRQAINYAVDRNKIINDVLKGEAYGPGEHGIVPPSFQGYDVSNIKGYTYDLEKAKQLLAEAGYPNGDGFPTIKLELNSGGYKNTSVAFEIQKQLMDNLNINIDLEVVDFSQKIEDERYGRADIFRTAWISDFPAPDNFLFMFYGKDVPSTLDEPSYPNVTRYKNEEFDTLYEEALSTLDQKKRYKLLAKAEQLMIEEAPIIVLWYKEDYKLIQSDIRNFYTNPMNYVDYSTIYRKDLKRNITKKGE